MTQEEKQKAIIERMKLNGQEFDPQCISTMVIIGYLNTLAELGLIQTAFGMTPIGKTVYSICDEFEWLPTNDDIMAFVNDMVEEPERPAFAFMIQKYRDDRPGLLKEIDKFKNNPENS